MSILESYLTQLFAAQSDDDAKTIMERFVEQQKELIFNLVQYDDVFKHLISYVNALFSEEIWNQIGLNLVHNPPLEDYDYDEIEYHELMEKITEAIIDSPKDPEILILNLIEQKELDSYDIYWLFRYVLRRKNVSDEERVIFILQTLVLLYYMRLEHLPYGNLKNKRYDTLFPNLFKRFKENYSELEIFFAYLMYKSSNSRKATENHEIAKLMYVLADAECINHNDDISDIYNDLLEISIADCGDSNDISTDGIKDNDKHLFDDIINESMDYAKNYAETEEDDMQILTDSISKINHLLWLKRLNIKIGKTHRSFSPQYKYDKEMKDEYTNFRNKYIEEHDGEVCDNIEQKRDESLNIANVEDSVNSIEEDNSQ